MSFSLFIVWFGLAVAQGESSKELDAKILKDLDFFITLNALEGSDEAAEILDGEEHESQKKEK